CRRAGRGCRWVLAGCLRRHPLAGPAALLQPAVPALRVGSGALRLDGRGWRPAALPRALLPGRGAARAGSVGSPAVAAFLTGMAGAAGGGGGVAAPACRGTLGTPGMAATDR